MLENVKKWSFLVKLRKMRCRSDALYSRHRILYQAETHWMEEINVLRNCETKPLTPITALTKGTADFVN